MQNVYAHFLEFVNESYVLQNISNENYVFCFCTCPQLKDVSKMWRSDWYEAYQQNTSHTNHIFHFYSTYNNAEYSPCQIGISWRWWMRG